MRERRCTRLGRREIARCDREGKDSHGNMCRSLSRIRTMCFEGSVSLGMLEW